MMTCSKWKEIGVLKECHCKFSEIAGKIHDEFNKLKHWYVILCTLLVSDDLGIMLPKVVYEL